MHKLLIAAAGVGALVLLNRSSSSGGPGRGGVPTLPNTVSTFDARTWNAPGAPFIVTSDPLLSSFDSRRFAVSALPGRSDRPLGNFYGQFGRW